MSMMVSFVLSFFPRDVLDEILNLIESVSEDFPSYSLIFLLKKCKTIVNCDSIHFVCFCVSVSSCCVLVYMLTYAYECIRGT